MDFTFVGVFFIVGHLIVRGFRHGDTYKVFDIIMTCVGLVLIMEGQYRLFSGWFRH